MLGRFATVHIPMSKGKGVSICARGDCFEQNRQAVFGAYLAEVGSMRAETAKEGAS